MSGLSHVFETNLPRVGAVGLTITIKYRLINSDININSIKLGSTKSCGLGSSLYIDSSEYEKYITAFKTQLIDQSVADIEEMKRIENEIKNHKQWLDEEKAITGGKL